MIYCLEQTLYPTQDKCVEEIKYQDENDFEWRIARVNNGFFVRYFGNQYFNFDTFICETKNEDLIRVKNTNCIFIEDSSFETFTEMRNILKTGFTDEIWDTLQDMFNERFKHDTGLLESEVVK